MLVSCLVLPVILDWINVVMESQSQTLDAVMETSKWRGDLGVWTGVILIGFILLGNSCVGVPWFQSGNIFFYTLRFFLQPSLLKAHTDTAQRSAHASYMIWQANKCTRWNMGFSVRILKRLPINSEWCASRDLCFLYLFFSFFYYKTEWMMRLNFNLLSI